MKKKEIAYWIIILLITIIIFVPFFINIIYDIVNQQMSEAVYKAILGFFSAALINLPIYIYSRNKSKKETKEQEEKQKTDKVTKSAEALQNRIFQHAASETTGEKNAVCIFCGRRVSAVDQDNLCETCAKLVNESDQ